jgi:hypothetical protein
MRTTVTTASSKAWVLSVKSARLFVASPAANSKTKTEEIATSEILRVLRLMAPTSAVVSESAATLDLTRDFVI